MDMEVATKPPRRGTPPRRRLLTTAEVAAEYGYSPNTLRVWRSRGFGPAWVKATGERSAGVRYRREAVEAWIDEHTVDPAADQAA